MSIDQSDGLLIDLNADAGESYGTWRLGDDAALLPLLTSVNIACGFHAGDPSTIRRTLDLAAAHGVAVNAHVSYPDLQGFGRREMAASAEQIEADTLYQVGALAALADAAGVRIVAVKPHGALYHRSLRDPASAAAIVSAVKAWQPSGILITAPGGELFVAARSAGLGVVTEGYVERGYAPDGQLIPRGSPGDVIDDPEEAASQAVALARTHRYRSLCIHGDSKLAVTTATATRAALTEAGFELRAPVPPGR